MHKTDKQKEMGYEFTAYLHRSYELGKLEDLEERLSIVERMDEPKGA